MNAEIIAVGTELLLGSIVNTNAQYISRRLAELGINEFFQTVVGDNSSRLKSALECSFARADLVILTGGLGPTEDDLTKEAVTEYFGETLVENAEALENIKKRFAGRLDAMSPNNYKQALVPENSIVLQNERGTAPGIIISKNGLTAMLLPGPPFEMKHMFDLGVMPYLKARSDSIFVSRTLRLAGIGESLAEDKIKHLLASNNPTVAFYAKETEVTIRITAKSAAQAEGLEMIKPVADAVYGILGEFIYGENELTLEENIINRIRENNMTLAAAESCTGGLLVARLINIPGVSDIFLEGAVTYSNEAKVKRLGVSEATLAAHGAVSSQTAEEMAVGIAKSAGTDIGISVTGIAGPGGGTDGKPVGLVYVGICIRGKTSVHELRHTGDRMRIRQRTVTSALYLLNKLLD